MALITGDEIAFPFNIVDKLEVRFGQVWPDTDIKLRPLTREDRSETLGIYPALWTPEEGSQEMSGISPGEPTLGQYLIMMQAYIKDSDRQRGARKHSVMVRRLVNVLYRDPLLHVALPATSVTDLGVTESLKRWGIRTVRYFSNDLSGTWVYLSTLEFFIETETT